jgi:hypothetical protein
VAQSRFAILTRHFLRRFLDNDLISPSGDAHVGLSQVLAAFVVPGLMIVATVLVKYASQYRLVWNEVVNHTFDDAVTYASLAMILLGAIATLTWDAFYLDSRDEVVLGSLPVSPRLLSAAKLASLGVFLGLFTVALNLIRVLFARLLTSQAVPHGDSRPVAPSHGRSGGSQHHGGRVDGAGCRGAAGPARLASASACVQAGRAAGPGGPRVSGPRLGRLAPTVSADGAFGLAGRRTGA